MMDLPTHDDLLPDGIRVVKDPYSGLGRPYRLHVIRDVDRAVVTFEIDPDDFKIVQYRRTGFLKWEPYETVDWDAMNDQLQERGYAAVRSLMETHDA